MKTVKNLLAVMLLASAPLACAVPTDPRANTPEAKAKRAARAKAKAEAEAGFERMEADADASFDLAAEKTKKGFFAKAGDKARWAGDKFEAGHNKVWGKVCNRMRTDFDHGADSRLAKHPRLVKGMKLGVDATAAAATITLITLLAKKGLKTKNGQKVVKKGKELARKAKAQVKALNPFGKKNAKPAPRRTRRRR